MASTHQHPHLITTSIQKLSLTSFPFCSKVEGMDQLKSQIKIAALTQSIKAHKYIIKLTQVLVSVSLFSVIFPPSTLLAFLHHFNFYFSTFPLQLFTHAIDKNCMFLLCNGLLVFVGITRSFSGSSGVDEPSKYIEDDSQYQYSDVKANEPMLVEKEVEEKTSEPDEQNTEAQEAIEIKYSGEEVEENIENIIFEDEVVNESGLSVLKVEEEPEEEEEERESEIDEFLVGENVEEEEVVDEGNWVLSTDELNKKFDDFIRRMKEDLRIEARQLVIV